MDNKKVIGAATAGDPNHDIIRVGPGLRPTCAADMDWGGVTYAISGDKITWLNLVH
jgi:hypothetical protein